MIRAAGGVPWRSTKMGDVEIALVHRPRYDDWSLPKGKLDPGEHPMHAAVREVSEETGLATQLGRWLVSTSYIVDGEPKHVDYWAMRAVDGQFVPGEEVDELRWLSPAAARSLVTSPADVTVVESFLTMPYDTTAVVLVRHGSAGDAGAWRGNDSRRPLDEIGRGQAETLAALLPAFRPARVASAEPVRCVQTVRPLADRIGVTVDVDPDFNEESKPGRMAERLRSLAAAGEPVVVCSQGGVIPHAVAALSRRDRVPVVSQGARKGSLWALHFTAAGVLVAADYLPRPGDNEPPSKD